MGNQLGTLLWFLAGTVFTAVVGEVLKRRLPHLPMRLLGWVIAIAILGAGILYVFQAPLEKGWQQVQGRATHMVEAPVGDAIVIGIYPKDGFGPAQEKGLKVALERYPGLTVVDLNAATIAEMKEGKAQPVLDELRRHLITRNVVAIVGPSVTEFTWPVIMTIERSGRSPPVFITSAAPRTAIGWGKTTVPLLRINSGVDERVHEFVGLAKQAVTNGVPLTFLVEKDRSRSKLYGDYVFAALMAEWPEFAGLGYEKVRWFPYRPGWIVEDVSRLTSIDDMLKQRRLVMVFGLGSDYQQLVEQYYKTSDPKRKALLGGWMNAYAIPRDFPAAKRQTRMMFELTDVDLDGPAAPEAARRDFLQAIGRVTPSVRDEAFAFDAGSLIGERFMEVVKARGVESPADVRVDNAFLAELTRRLKSTQAVGVTGRIEFDAKGQNIGVRGPEKRLLTYTWLDKGEWKRLSGPSELLSRLPAQ